MRYIFDKKKIELKFFLSLFTHLLLQQAHLHGIMCERIYWDIYLSRRITRVDGRFVKRTW